MKYVPNILTILRLLACPLLIYLFYSKKHLAVLIIFLLACITDFFDGYLARKKNFKSNLGKILDPIADKILVVSMIFIMVVIEKINGFLVYPALVIILREILVSGLRDFFSYKMQNLLVTKLSKLKTLIQMVSLGFLIVQDNFETNFIYLIGAFGLTVSSILTIYTGYLYFKRNINFF